MIGRFISWFVSWIVFTALPLSSLIGSVLGTLAIIYYNEVIQQNQTLGSWSYLGLIACVVWFCMGIIGWKAPRG